LWSTPLGNKKVNYAIPIARFFNRLLGCITTSRNKKLLATLRARFPDLHLL